MIATQKVGPAGRVIGIDMTDAMIAAARRNIAEAGAENVEVRKGLIEELPVERQTLYNYERRSKVLTKLL